jgi:dTMP kinase
VFITFEGVEGSGKSTQLRRLADYLRNRGVAVEVTFEPGGTPMGDAVRGILLDPKSHIEPGAELFLMMASRRQLVEEVIRPALAQGKVVLSARFVDASFAYQGFGRGVGLEMVEALARWACREIWPDRTLLFDIPAEIGLNRAVSTGKKEAAAGQGDRIERCGSAFLETVRQGYLEMARREPSRYTVIPVTGNADQTYNDMISIVSQWFGIAE